MQVEPDAVEAQAVAASSMLAMLVGFAAQALGAHVGSTVHAPSEHVAESDAV